MATIILVPGAYHGGWYFSPIVPQLRDAGHEVYTVTLSGLLPQNRSLAGVVNLDTHIDDLVQLIEHEQLDDICLVGHSYGGMVIAGAADRLPGRIRTLLFLDAMVPADGDSVWSIWPQGEREMFVAAATDGLLSQPPPGLDPRAMAHPLATFLQPIVLTHDSYPVINKIFAWCSSNSNSVFEATYDRYSLNDDWVMHKLACGHDIIGEAPQIAADIVEQSAAL